MYPRQFLDSFWSPEFRDAAFVAMSFAEVFTPVYEQMIAPACEVDNGLKPLRLDLERGGDAIVTQMLDGIAHSRLVIAEISTLRPGDHTSRNGNVMWEVGVAHAFRQHDEVLLLRNDRDKLLFDIGQIRVHSYDRDDLEEGRRSLGMLIADRLRSIDFQKSLQLQKTLLALDPATLSMLLTTVPLTEDTFQLKLPALPQQMIMKLFDLGILAFADDAITPLTVGLIQKEKSVAPALNYRITSFGKAVLDHLMSVLRQTTDETCE